MPRSLVLASALALVALPATAQRTDYMNGNYQHGVESGAVPQTASNMVACATHWAVWSQSAATDWDADFIADLDPDLRPAESQLAAGYWATMASDRYEAETGDTARFEQEIGIATPQAIQSYSNLMTGSDARVRYHIFRILGACHLTFEQPIIFPWLRRKWAGRASGRVDGGLSPTALRAPPPQAGEDNP